MAEVALATRQPLTIKPSPVVGVQDFAIVRAYSGTTPPPPVPKNEDNRQVPSDPRESWMLQLPYKLTPKQILNILRAGLAGDSYRAWQLSSLMLQTWPMLRKCSHELRSAVATTRFVVKEYAAVKSKEASSKAKEKADLVRRAMANFAPAQFTDERGWHSMIYDLCDAMLTGISTVEMLWHPVTDWGSGPEKLPRAAAWAHPRHFTFTQSGVLMRCSSNAYSQFLTFPGQEGSYNATLLSPTAFLCAQFKSQTGSALAEGFIRPLALDWAGMTFCYEPMLVAAQNFGAPFVDLTYASGMQKEQIDELIRRIEYGLSNHVFAHVEGSTLVMEAGKATGGSDNAQKVIMELADLHCMELLLGTDATTKSKSGLNAGTADNSSQDKTKNERVRALAHWVANEVLSHFVDAVLYQNYGKNDPSALSEKPTIEPDFTQPLTAQEKGAVITALASCKTPMLVEDYYELIGTTSPDEGDKVINPSTGEIGLIGSTEEEFKVAQAVPAPPVQLGPDGKPLPPAATDDSGNEEAGLNRTLAKATKKELEALLPLIQAAKAAPHFNGEHTLLVRHLEKIKARK